MAGVGINPGGGAVTGLPGGNEDPYTADLNALAQQQLAAAQKAAGQQNLEFLQGLTDEQRTALMASLQGQQQQQQQQAPAPIKVPIGGQTYEFESPEKLGEHLTAYYQNVMAEAEKLKGQQEAVVPDQQAPAKVDIKKFVDLLGDDPAAAMEYVDSIRYFDGKVDNPSEVIRERLAAAEDTERQLAIYQFKAAHPELVGNPQAAQIIDNIREEQGKPFTFENIEAAHGVAVSRGLIPSRQAMQLMQQYQAQLQQLQQQQQSQGGIEGLQAPGFTQKTQQPGVNGVNTQSPFGQNQGAPFQQPPLFGNMQFPGQAPQLQMPPAPPQVGGGVQEQTGLNFNPEDMTADQLEAILSKFQQ